MIKDIRKGTRSLPSLLPPQLSRKSRLKTSQSIGRSYPTAASTVGTQHIQLRTQRRRRDTQPTSSGAGSERATGSPSFPLPCGDRFTGAAGQQRVQSALRHPLTSAMPPGCTPSRPLLLLCSLLRASSRTLRLPTVKEAAESSAHTWPGLEMEQDPGTFSSARRLERPALPHRSSSHFTPLTQPSIEEHLERPFRTFTREMR